MSESDGNKSLTSTNKWKYVPGKVFTITPLNLQDIRKQLLDTSNEESDDSQGEAEGENKICDILNESFNAGSPTSDSSNQVPKENEINQICSDNHNKMYINDAEKHVHKHMSFSTSLETVPEDIVRVNSTAQKENIVSNIEPLNLSKNKKKNDSFDLDFSALSLCTPVKKLERDWNVTPKINIIPPTETKSALKSMPLFKTPILANKSHPISKPLFKTPVNKPTLPTLYSVKKNHGTPFSTASKNPSNNLYNSMLDNQKAKSVIYSSEDGFDRICVNEIEYVVMKMLGRGGSCEVYSGFNTDQKLEVAIKVVSLSDQVSAEGYINEVKLLESLQVCDRIIKMYDYEVQEKTLIVVLEKGGDDLSTILKQLATKQTHLPTYMLLFYWMEMLYAVKQIHENGVIHSDLKPANFLRDESGLKLIDFGIASKVQGDMTCVYKTNQEGSCNYISPEALSLQTTGNVDSPNYGKLKYKVHFKSDVWSLGCILYQLVYRRTPFQHVNQMWAKLAMITDQNHKIHYPEAEWVSPRIIKTLKRCLQYDVKSRPSVDELIEEYEQLLKII